MICYRGGAPGLADTGSRGQDHYLATTDQSERAINSGPADVDSSPLLRALARFLPAIHAVPYGCDLPGAARIALHPRAQIIHEIMEVVIGGGVERAHHGRA